MDDTPFNIIYSYTRQQAIEDGVLIDVAELARESGFKVPVAVSDHLFHSYVEPAGGLEGEGQSVAGRLHDLFWMSQAAIKNRLDGDRVEFVCMFLMPRKVLQSVKCVAIIGPGDHGEPVLTICLPGDE